MADSLFSDMVLLEVTGLSKKEKTGFAVKDIAFTLDSGTNLAIIGETGSGKTSVLKMIGGLMQPDEGAVLLSGERVLGPFEKLLPGHPRIGYLSQHFELRNNYRVEEELECKNLLTQEAATEIYAICRISHLLQRRTDQLSGGERQRIVLARLLTMSPSLLLLDEPFSNMDRSHTQLIREVLKEISRRFRISCIMVSHDAEELLSWADRILVMRDGLIIQDSDPLTVYEHPVDAYTASLLGDYTYLPAALVFPDNKEMQEKQVMLRPEKFIVTDADDALLRGQVKEVAYCGSHYLLLVEVGETIVKVKTSGKINPGERIGLTLFRYS